MLSSNVKTFNDEIQQNQDENSINFTKTNASKQLSFSVDRILSMERSNDVIYRHDVNESQTIIRPTPMRFIAPNQSSITGNLIDRTNKKTRRNQTIKSNEIKYTEFDRSEEENQTNHIHSGTHKII